MLASSICDASKSALLSTATGVTPTTLLPGTVILRRVMGSSALTPQKEPRDVQGAVVDPITPFAPETSIVQVPLRKYVTRSAPTAAMLPPGKVMTKASPKKFSTRTIEGAPNAPFPNSASSHVVTQASCAGLLVNCTPARIAPAGKQGLLLVPSSGPGQPMTPPVGTFPCSKSSTARFGADA